MVRKGKMATHKGDMKEVLTGTHVTHASAKTLHAADGTTIRFDEAIWCTQGGAAEWLQTTGLALDGAGFIAVHPTLESISSPGVFACGDVAAVLGSVFERLMSTGSVIGLDEVEASAAETTSLNPQRAFGDEAEGDAHAAPQPPKK